MGVMRKLHKTLKQIGLITHDLSMPTDLDALDAKYMGLCTLPQPGSIQRRIGAEMFFLFTNASTPLNSILGVPFCLFSLMVFDMSSLCFVDILAVPFDELGSTFIYFTGLTSFLPCPSPLSLFILLLETKTLPLSFLLWGFGGPSKGTRHLIDRYVSKLII